MSFLGAIITLVLSLLVVVGSQTLAAVAIILAVCYITQGQEFVLFFHFTAIRTILLFAFIRVLSRGELRRSSKNPLDRYIAIYALCISIACIARVPTSDEFIYQLGVLYNVLLSYYVFRGLVPNWASIARILNFLAPLLLPFAIAMIIEANTGSSVFIAFGGLDGSESVVRDNHVRCQGAFRQAITAGSFGATFALFYIGMVFATAARRRIHILGFILSSVVLISARSSGPLLGFLIGILSLLLWRYRHKMRTLRWGIVGFFIIITIFMKDPPWFILAKLGDLVGGGGWHRAYLIDRFIHSFGEWWLFGSDDTSSWFPYKLYNGRADITNQFVSDGLNGGTLGLILSIGLVVLCYNQLGKARRISATRDPQAERMVWCIASVFTATIAILFSVTYFDQMQVIWYFLIACIAGVVEESITSDPFHKYSYVYDDTSKFSLDTLRRLDHLGA